MSRARVERSAATVAWLSARRVHLAVLGGLVVLAFVQRPGATTFDTKLDLTENPWGFLGRALSLWNPQSNFGELQNQAFGYLFPIGPYYAVGDLLGLPSWVVQRSWTALLLAAAYIGVVALCRALPVGTRWSRVAAGLAYALCPRMVTTLGPISAEALIVALLPWTVLPLLRWREWGVRRAAALSAVGIAGMGAANATLTLAVLPLAGLVALTRPRGVRARLACWWAVCVALACAWWVGPLVVLGRYSPPFLDYIESAGNTAAGVGISEILRGTTHWVAGVAIGGQSWWPSGHALVTTSWLVIATSVAGVAGALGLLDRRVPARTALLGSAALGLVLMSLGWDGSLASPVSDGWRALLDGPLAAFRNVHKFDPLVRLPVAIGLAHVIGLVLTSHRGRAAAPLRAGVAAGLVACSLAPLVPALSPGLRPGPGWDAIPPWWSAAADFVDERDVEGRTLVLPSSGFGTQVWGRTVDEPLQPLAESPWVSRSQVFLGGDGAARLLEAVDGWVESGRGSPVLGKVLARAGIRFVIVRGDLDRRMSGTPPVAIVRQALERSGGVSSVAQFGPVRGDGGAAGLRVSGFAVDHSTPAIEIFEVDEPVAVAHLAAAESITGVSGGPESIPRLIEDGLIGPTQPAVLAMDEPRNPRRWLVTDDLALRERNFGRIRENLGPVRAAEEPTRQERATGDLLGEDADGHRAVARYGGVAGVSASTSQGYPDSALATKTEFGPWSALDGDPFTAWRSDAGGEPVGEWIRVDLDEPKSLDTLDIRFVNSRLVGPRIAAVEVHTEAGVQRNVVRGDGSVESLAVPAGWTTFVRVEVTEVGGEAEGTAEREVGILGLDLPGIRPERTVVAPSDQPASVRRAGAPSGISFHRLDPTRGACMVVGISTRCDPGLPVRGDEPTSLVRSFTTHASGTYHLRGTALARPGDASQRLLQPAGVRAGGSSTLAGDPGVAAVRAVDGNPATSWVADSFDGLPTMRLDWSQVRRVDAFRIVSAVHPVASRPTAVQVEINGVRRDLDVVDGWVRFPAVRTDAIAVTVTRWAPVYSIDPRTGVPTAVPPGIAELQIPAVEDLVVPPELDAPTGRPCGFGPTVLLDGVLVGTEVGGEIRDVFENRPLRWSACGDAAAGIDLSSGQHTIEVRTDGLFVADTAVLRRAFAGGIGSGLPGHIDVRQWDSTERTLGVRTTEPSLLVVPENASPGWVAQADGENLPAARVDGWQQAWELPAGFEGDVEIVFTPQGEFEAGLVVGAAGLVALTGLAAIRPRRLVAPSLPDRSGSPGSRLRPIMTILAALTLGALMAGVVGAVAFGLAATIPPSRRRTAVVGAAAAGVAVIGVALSLALRSEQAELVRTWACLPIVAMVGGAAVRAFAGVDRDQFISAVAPMAAWKRLRIWVQMAYALIVLQLVWRAWSLSHSHFWQDDFVYVHQASQGLSLGYLFQDYEGHLMPGQFLLSWVLSELAPLAWLPAAGLVVGLQVIASLLVLRLVRDMVGDGPLGFVVLAIYLLSPIAFTASVWWASALQALPLQICMAWALGAHLRYLRTGSSRALAMTVLAILVGLLFWQKAVLIPPLLVAFTLTVGPLFTGRSLGGLLRRCAGAMAAYLALALAYGIAYFLITEQDGSGLPTGTELWQQLQFSVIDTFVPGLFGVMGGAEPAGALLAPDPSIQVLLVSWQIFGLAVIASLVAAGWAAARAWLLLLGYILVDVALVVSTRLDFAGTVVGRDPRYIADAVVVAVVALAAVGAAVRDRRTALPPVLWRHRAVLSGALVLALVNTCLISTYAVVQRLPMGAAANFVANAREAAGRPGGVDLVDGAVPEYVIASFFVEQARAAVVVGALPQQPRFGQPTADLRVLDGLGQPQPIDIRATAHAEPDRASSCDWSVRRDQVEFRLETDVPAGQWVVRVGYFNRSPTTGRLVIGGRTHDVELLAGLHHLYLEFSNAEPLGRISLGDLPAGDATCVTDVVVGAPWPRQAG